MNLAARLEGVNKLYGTEILFSSATAAQLNGALPLRQVDRVIVKGKTEAVEILTTSDDSVVNELTAAALQAYQQQNWDESEAQWLQVLAQNPQDKIAQIYLERIAAYRQEPPAERWSGAIALEKL